MEETTIMLKEFKAFAVRGNVVDLAVAVILGVAFGQVVTSLVNDVVMPPIGLLIGELDFSALFLDLSVDREYATLAAAREAGVPTIAYGLFINAVVSFLIVAGAMFLIVRQINRLRAALDTGETAPPVPAAKACPHCLSTIAAAATRCPHCTSHLEQSVAEGESA